MFSVLFFFQAEDGIRYLVRSRGLGDVYKRQRPRRFGRVEIDPASREVTVDGETVALRAKEFDLLLTLAEHANQVLSREQLLDRVWGYEFYGQTRTVDVHVAHLRDRLTGSGLEIETVWGLSLIHI